jgi:hypothetical protein
LRKQIELNRDLYPEGMISSMISSMIISSRPLVDDPNPSGYSKFFWGDKLAKVSPIMLLDRS